MSRSAVAVAGTSTSTSTWGESRPFMPVRMWWQMLAGLLGDMSRTQPAGRLSAPKWVPEYSSAGLAAAGPLAMMTAGQRRRNGDRDQPLVHPFRPS